MLRIKKSNGYWLLNYLQYRLLASQSRGKSCRMTLILYGQSFESFLPWKLMFRLPTVNCQLSQTLFGFISIGAPVSLHFHSVQTQRFNIFYFSNTESVVCNFSIILYMFLYMTLLTNDFFYKTFSDIFSNDVYFAEVLLYFVQHNTFPICTVHLPIKGKCVWLSPLSKLALYFPVLRDMIGGTRCISQINNLSLYYKCDSIIHVMLRIFTLVLITHECDVCKAQSGTTAQGTYVSKYVN